MNILNVLPKEKCSGCGLCSEVCPKTSISVTFRYTANASPKACQVSSSVISLSELPWANADRISYSFFAVKNIFNRSSLVSPIKKALFSATAAVIEEKFVELESKHSRAKIE